MCMIIYFCYQAYHKQILPHADSIIWLVSCSLEDLEAIHCIMHTHYDHQWADLLWTDYRRKCEQEVVRGFDCLHFAQYILLSRHSIDFKQTWCKKITCMDSVINLDWWGKPLATLLGVQTFIQLVSTPHSHPKRCFISAMRSESWLSPFIYKNTDAVHVHLHGGDTSWPIQFQNGGPQAIYETMHIEYRIVCCIETYLIHIYRISKCSKCNWNMYIEGLCIWNVHFHINGLSPNIAYVILMSFNGNLFSFIEFLTIFCAVSISYLMVINNKKNINQNIQTSFGE